MSDGAQVERIERRPNRHRHGAEVDGHVVAHRDHVPGCIKNGA